MRAARREFDVTSTTSLLPRSAVALAAALSLAACASSIVGEPGDPDPGAGEHGPDAGGGGTGAEESESPAALIVVLSFDGETLTPGTADDPATNRTAILSPGVANAVIPPFDASVIDAIRPRHEVMADLAGAVADLFAPFDVEVRTDRPSGGDYALVVLGGAAADIGAAHGISALAQLDCHNAAGFSSVAFVFTGEPNIFAGLTYHERIGRAAALVASSVGYGLGLEPVTDCPDVMANPFVCGSQRFTESEIPCSQGSPQARDCLCGGTTQSSARRLDDVLRSGR
jgi:hypothetical protein